MPDYVNDIEYNVKCSECGCYFVLSCIDGSLGEIFGECPECGNEDEHPIVKDGTKGETRR